MSVPAHAPGRAAFTGPLPLILLDRASMNPARAYLEDVSGRQVSYAEFLALVGKYMTHLWRLGVGPGDRVAVLMPQGIDAHAVWLAIVWLGGWEVPVNIEFHGDMLAYLMADAKARIAVVAPDLAGALARIANRLEHLQSILVTDPSFGGHSYDFGRASVSCFDAGVDAHADVRLAPSIGDGDVATVIYTSGTTGPSKGVLVPWGEFYTALDIYGCRKDGSDVLYTPFPINHLSGKVPIYDMAALGGKAVLRRRFSVGEFWSDVRSHGCTATILLGGTAAFLANQPAAPTDRDHGMRNVVMVPVMDDYQAFAERFSLSIMTIYGMSECGWPFMSPPTGLANARSCGRLRDGWHVRIVDAAGIDVPVGDAGELLVRCDQPHALMRGYLDRPEATQNALRDGWFHTGDAFRADVDGNYYFVDRLKDAIRRRGENISSFEVETLALKYPQLGECAAVAVPAETGEDEIKLVCTGRDGQAVDLEGLARFCAEQMPGFMVPRYFEQLPALPYTPTNKVQKTALRATGIGNAWDRLLHRATVPQDKNASTNRR